jgi:mono/diheme cytochrome c family protein
MRESSLYVSFMFLFTINSFADDLYFRGKLVYDANCIVCHNSNPKIKGSIGPEIYGSSELLLKKKVLEGKYPDYYTPKRNTNIMPKLPQLSKEIEVLYKYLNGVK